jgi:hypothetical protein
VFKYTEDAVADGTIIKLYPAHHTSAVTIMIEIFVLSNDDFWTISKCHTMLYTQHVLRITITTPYTLVSTDEGQYVFCNTPNCILLLWGHLLINL